MAKIIQLKDIPHSPWKNGGGATRELYKVAHPTLEGRFILRVSVAIVEKTGPFSYFENTDRILLLLKGSGLLLKRKSSPDIIINQTLCPISFKGEEEIVGEILLGPVKDFNIMTDRTAGHSQAMILDFTSGEEVRYQGSRGKFLYLAEGSISLAGKIYNENLLLVLEDTDIQFVCETHTSLIEITFKYF